MDPLMVNLTAQDLAPKISAPHPFRTHNCRCPSWVASRLQLCMDTLSLARQALQVAGFGFHVVCCWGSTHSLAHSLTMMTKGQPHSWCVRATINNSYGQRRVNPWLRYQPLSLWSSSTVLMELQAGSPIKHESFPSFMGHLTLSTIISPWLIDIDSIPMKSHESLDFTWQAGKLRPMPGPIRQRQVASPSRATSSWFASPLRPIHKGCRKPHWR